VARSWGWVLAVASPAPRWQREHRQPGRRDRAVALDQSAIAKSHLAQDVVVHHKSFRVDAQRSTLSRSTHQPPRYWNSDIFCTIEYDFSAAS
jgi:hypothetical protein